MSKIIYTLIGILIVVGIFVILRYAENVDKGSSGGAQKAQVVNYADWHEFSSPLGQFKVLLPTLPQRVMDKIVDPKTKAVRQYDTYISAKDENTAFIINRIVLPEKVEENSIESVLISIVNEILARNQDNKLKMVHLGDFRNNKSLDFVVENENVTIGGKAILHRDTIYVLSMIAKNGMFNPEEYNFFINSFMITEQSK
jgi:hypothetical protein